MSKIGYLSLNQTFNLFKTANFLIVDDSPKLSQWDLSELTGKKEYICVEINWEGGFRKFSERSLSYAKKKGNKIFLIDWDGKECEITFFINPFKFVMSPYLERVKT